VDCFNRAADLLVDGYMADTSGTGGSAATHLELIARADGGTFQATGAGTHQRYTNQKGFLFIESISASQDDPQGTVVDLIYYPLSLTGAAADVPLVPSFENTTVAPGYDDTHYLGPLSLTTVATGNPGALLPIVGLQSVRIESGIQFSPKRGSGDAFATIGSIIERRPTFTFVTNDPNDVFDSGYASLFGDDMNASFKVVQYFRDGLPGSRRVADAAARNLAIYCETGDWTGDGFSVQQTGDTEWTWVVRPTGTLATLFDNAIP
jgi:hypothetical protein